MKSKRDFSTASLVVIGVDIGRAYGNSMIASPLSAAETRRYPCAVVSSRRPR